MIAALALLNGAPSTGLIMAPVMRPMGALRAAPTRTMLARMEGNPLDVDECIVDAESAAEQRRAVEAHLHGQRRQPVADADREALEGPLTPHSGGGARAGGRARSPSRQKTLWYNNDDDDDDNNNNLLMLMMLMMLMMIYYYYY